MTPYLRAVAYMAQRSPIGRVSHGVGWNQDWRQDHQELGWALSSSGGGIEYRLLEDNVRDRMAAEHECRAIAAKHERNAILKARQAGNALTSARRQADALDALSERDRASALLFEAAVHKGKAARIHADIEMEHWHDARAREWVPPRKPRGRQY
jgi:hypothetical protein